MPNSIYAIGDIHGDLDQLKLIHQRICQDQNWQPSSTIVHLGDVVDRRANSKGCIEFLLTGQNSGAPWVVLKGNHDRLFLKFLTDPNWKDPVLRPDYDWLHPNMGGRSTLASYGVDVSESRPIADIQRQASELVPPQHLRFLQDMPLSYPIDTLLFVHAGIRPGLPLTEQTEDDLLWIRKEFHSYLQPHPHLIIHGHTVIDKVTHYGNRVNIDTGAGYGKPLSAIVIEAGEIFQLTAAGRVALPPPQG